MSEERPMPERKIHMAQSVRGALRLTNNELARRCFRNDAGRVLSGAEAREALMDELAKGHELIPIGDCEGFDFKTGCPGHPIPSDEGSSR